MDCGFHGLICRSEWRILDFETFTISGTRKHRAFFEIAVSGRKRAVSKIIPDPENAFRDFVPDRRPLLRVLEEEAAREHIPIVGPLVGELLYILARTAGTTRILELGTATGYSALFLGRACLAAGGRVVTVEADRALAERARENFRRDGLDRVIDVVVCDALETLREMEGPFELVFIDIEKKDYARMLPDLERLVPPGGLLIADNTAFPDAQDFNRKIYGRPGWRSVQLLAFLPEHSPERDGLCLALRE